ncbi:uncharacterized protein LOC135464060 isoform X1 [Liolophura sinensis]|uniref:uncharacterized protein LOC135464060 isoform X1 n=1 Tax=Liolophura sinensis TaxID=3198878 RepID=UPI0031591D27
MDSSELEHVQYKFATIIGGLCGKPQILSQFAVWLDLRLAEYKLKGAISLDCSGLKPDPKWLEGIKPDIIDSEQCTGGTDMGRPGEVTLFSQDSSQDASGEVNPVQSPALVIKTEEDAGSVFPVSLHEHSHNAKDLPTSALHSVATRETQSLKRRFQHTGHSLGQKTKRLSSSSEVDLQGVEIVPVNESLMSLIGSTSDSKDNGTNDSVNEYDSGTPFDENSSYTSLLDDSTVVHQAKAVSVAGRLLSQTALDEHGTSCSSPGVHQDDLPLGAHEVIRKMSQSASIFPVPMKSNESRRNRIRNRHQKAEKTVRNVVGAVGNFERWLWSRFSDETREIFAIPPAELDRYLALFFSEAEKLTGGSFHPETFRSLRSRLESYLKDNNYPESIMHSPHFSESRRAYHQRKLKLMAIVNDGQQSTSKPMNSTA